MKSVGSLFFSLLVLSIHVAPLAAQSTPSTTATSLTPTTTRADPTSSTTTTTSATTEDTTSTTTSATTTSPTTTNPETTPGTTTNPPANLPPQTTQSLTTIDGTEVTVTVTGPATTPATTTSAKPSNTADPDGDTSLGPGSIIGLSVAGGVAVIGIIGFFVWKFTRKRFTDLGGDEAIKWPDLNNNTTSGNTHALPVHNTGRAGFDTGSDGSLSRVASSTNNYSTPDFNSGIHDPYAVPPLPHLNPNQPYRDDPSNSGAYYDPYHGPVPGTLEGHSTGHGHEWNGSEAIPMTQMGAAGRMSPGPHAAYGAPGVPEQYPHDAGRQSPGPYNAYGGGGPEQPQYDVGRQSPGPYGAYGGGRSSPGPHVAYGGHGAPGVPYGGR